MQPNNVFKDWLTTNKISEEIQRQFNISFSEDIIIPVHDLEGDFIFNKYRRSPLSDDKPKYWYDKGGKVMLYAWYKAKDEKNILIVEGEKDCLVSWSHNIPAVTSTGGAQSFQAEWADLFKDKNVIICLDNDEAGAVGTVKILELIPHAKVLLLPDRPGVKDISDYVVSGGSLHDLLKTARHYNSMADVHQDRTERLATWKGTQFHDAYIKAHTRKSTYTPRKKESSDEVTNAKLYPIPNLLEFRQNKACCPFHNEKTPSLHYYEKTNSCYCFGGCGKAYDAISIYRQLNNCSFKEAVTALNKMQ